MRINAYNKVSQIYEAHNTSKIIKKGKEGKQDKVEISSTGKDIQLVKEEILKTSDIRKDKVEDIIKAMESGSYNVSAKEVASKIVDGFFDKKI